MRNAPLFASAANVFAETSPRDYAIPPKMFPVVTLCPDRDIGAAGCVLEPSRIRSSLQFSLEDPLMSHSVGLAIRVGVPRKRSCAVDATHTTMRCRHRSGVHSFAYPMVTASIWCDRFSTIVRERFCPSLQQIRITLKGLVRCVGSPKFSVGPSTTPLPRQRSQSG